MRVLKSLVIITVITMMVSCGNQKPEASSLETEIDSASYALGMDMAIKIKANFDEANTDLFLQGYKNAMDSTNLLIDSKELNTFLRNFFQKLQMKNMEKARKKAEDEALVKFGDIKKAGEEFLAENKTKKGVITTDSGLQYIVLKEGKGDKPGVNSRVKVHYHGTLIDGTVFESTVENNQPAEFNVNQVVKGWTEGLQLMKKGAKYKFFIPQELGYGAHPRSGGAIKPLMALVFEIELLDIIK
jgi:FKBP-type peptidyl-prolyl cis-trans isomerase FklB